MLADIATISPRAKNPRVELTNQQKSLAPASDGAVSVADGHCPKAKGTKLMSMTVKTTDLVVEDVSGEDDWEECDSEPVGAIDLCSIIIRNKQAFMWPDIIVGIISHLPRKQREEVMQGLFESDSIPWPQGTRGP
jgi:hypothetical protein